MTFARIDPEDFEAAAIEEPTPQADETYGLKLHSLILTDEGQLLAAAAIPPQVADITLRIFKRDEALPTFSWKIDPAKTDITLSLKDDDQAKFDRPAVGQLQGVSVASNAVSAILQSRPWSRSRKRWKLT